MLLCAGIVLQHFLFYLGASTVTRQPTQLAVACMPITVLKCLSFTWCWQAHDALHVSHKTLWSHTQDATQVPTYCELAAQISYHPSWLANQTAYMYAHKEMCPYVGHCGYARICEYCYHSYIAQKPHSTRVKVYVDWQLRCECYRTSKDFGVSCTRL